MSPREATLPCWTGIGSAVGALDWCRNWKACGGLCGSNGLQKLLNERPVIARIEKVV